MADKSLVVATSRNVVVNSGAVVATVDGRLWLSANQQVRTTPGNFSGVEIKGKVESTGKGEVIVEGHAGSKSTDSDLAGVRIDGGTISGGKTGEASIRGNTAVAAAAGSSSRATGTGARLHGVSVVNSGRITTAGGSVNVEGQGGT